MATATRTCDEQDCIEQTSRPSHPLCYEHYLEHKDGTISPCSDCQKAYKPAKYQVCRSCNRSGTGWDHPPEPECQPPPAILVDAVELVRRNISKHADACSNNETNTTQYLVEPLLIGLGWDIRNPDLVIKEYRVEGKRRSRRNIRVDIALLRDDRHPIAFVEVKRLDRNYDPQYMDQLENYASHMDNGVAVLTNGRHWLIGNVTDGVAQPPRPVDIQNGSAERVAQILNGFVGRTASDQQPSTSEQIMEVLKDYRRREAKRRRRPAFTILSDETIALIAESKPTDTNELQSIKGVGPTTLRQHSTAILKIVAGQQP